MFCKLINLSNPDLLTYFSTRFDIEMQCVVRVVYLKTTTIRTNNYVTAKLEENAMKLEL